MTPEPALPRQPRALAERLGGGERQVGLMVKMPAPAMVELAGLVGLDLLVLDTEHGSADGQDLQHHLRAATAVGLPALVRVDRPSATGILHALDAGADGVVIPHVETAAEAAAAVAAAHYPPSGTRSLALSTRGGSYGRRSIAAHLAEARRRTVVVVQLESIAAVERADEILATPGLSAAFVGALDLSASLGHPGEYEHPACLAAVERILAAGEATGVPLCAMVGDEQGAAEWFERGGRVALFEASLLMARRLQELATASRALPHASASS